MFQLVTHKIIDAERDEITDMTALAIRNDDGIAKTEFEVTADRSLVEELQLSMQRQRSVIAEQAEIIGQLHQDAEVALAECERVEKMHNNIGQELETVRRESASALEKMRLEHETAIFKLVNGHFREMNQLKSQHADFINSEKALEHQDPLSEDCRDVHADRVGHTPNEARPPQASADVLPQDRSQNVLGEVESVVVRSTPTRLGVPERSSTAQGKDLAVSESFPRAEQRTQSMTVTASTHMGSSGFAQHASPRVDAHQRLKPRRKVNRHDSTEMNNGTSLLRLAKADENPQSADHNFTPSFVIYEDEDRSRDLGGLPRSAVTVYGSSSGLIEEIAESNIQPLSFMALSRSNQSLQTSETLEADGSSSSLSEVQISTPSSWKDLTGLAKSLDLENGPSRLRSNSVNGMILDGARTKIPDQERTVSDSQDELAQRNQIEIRSRRSQAPPNSASKMARHTSQKSAGHGSKTLIAATESGSARNVPNAAGGGPTVAHFPLLEGSKYLLLKPAMSSPVLQPNPTSQNVSALKHRPGRSDASTEDQIGRDELATKTHGGQNHQFSKKSSKVSSDWDGASTVMETQPEEHARAQTSLVKTSSHQASAGTGVSAFSDYTARAPSAKRARGLGTGRGNKRRKGSNSTSLWSLLTSVLVLANPSFPR